MNTVSIWTTVVRCINFEITLKGISMLAIRLAQCVPSLDSSSYKTTWFQLQGKRMRVFSLHIWYHFPWIAKNRKAYTPAVIQFILVHWTHNWVMIIRRQRISYSSLSLLEREEFVCSSKEMDKMILLCKMARHGKYIWRNYGFWPKKFLRGLENLLMLCKEWKLSPKGYNAPMWIAWKWFAFITLKFHCSP